jgi:hypothetical protein
MVGKENVDVSKRHLFVNVKELHINQLINPMGQIPC